MLTICNLNLPLQDRESIDPIDRMSTNQVVKILSDAYQSSDYAMGTISRIHEILQMQGTLLEAGGSQASFFKQCLTLTRRSFVNMSRDIGYYWLRLVIYIVLSLCLGSIFYDLNTKYEGILVRLLHSAKVSGVSHLKRCTCSVKISKCKSFTQSNSYLTGKSRMHRLRGRVFDLHVHWGIPIVRGGYEGTDLHSCSMDAIIYLDVKN